jgi:hypothetical protein
MEINSSVVQSFKGYLNSVEFDNEAVFRSVEAVLYEIDNEFEDISLKNTFIEDLRNAVNTVYSKSNWKIDEIEDCLTDCVARAESFSELKLKVDYYENVFETINNNIKNGSYLAM